VSCLFSKRGHSWSPLAGLRTTNWDFAIRCCGACGASGRVNKQGQVVTLWEPKMCGYVTRWVETPGNITFHSCHLPEGHEGDHDETYPARRR
jgi:hypothetical protein